MTKLDLSVLTSLLTLISLEKKSCKSTSGVFFAVCGPNSRWPIIGQSKKQPVTSHSTPESQIVAYSLGLRTIGLPAILLWSTLLGKNGNEVWLQVREDNDAMVRVLTTGRNPTMRYLSLIHGIRINRLHQVSPGPYMLSLITT